MISKPHKLGMMAQTVSALRMEEAGSEEFKGHIKQEQKNNPDPALSLEINNVLCIFQKPTGEILIVSIGKNYQRVSGVFQGRTCLALTG